MSITNCNDHHVTSYFRSYYIPNQYLICVVSAKRLYIKSNAESYKNSMTDYKISIMTFCYFVKSNEQCPRPEIFTLFVLAVPG